MKKLLVLYILPIFILTGCQHAQSGWVTHKVDERITIKFPSSPKQLKPGSFLALGKNGSYVFTLVNFMQVAGIDSTALAPVKATSAFAAQMKTGLKKTLPDVTLDDFKIGKWNGFTSYTTSGFDSKKKRYDLFMFIIGDNLYSLSAVTANGASLKEKDTFFSSVTLTP